MALTNFQVIFGKFASFGNFHIIQKPNVKLLPVQLPLLYMFQNYPFFGSFNQKENI